ncbi:MAG TPA: hypothetical protein DCZ40_00580 [Lachnospiraceae bacterium]|nr:hypothetical protein [Lachnospiraceae bacterium]
MVEKTIRIEDENSIKASVPESNLHFISEMHSDAGICKLVNEDACCARMMKVGEHFLVMAAVCDGVGGLQEGDYASKSTVQCLNNWFDYTVSKNIQGKTKEQLIDYMQKEMERCIQEQNRLIYSYAKDKEIRVGTTLTLLFIIDGEYIIAQVGDSRAYCMKDKVLQLTEDQSVVAREVKAGRLSREAARYDKRRNLILQCVGASEFLQIAYKRGSIAQGEIIFLCSDGFIHELGEDEIGELLKPSLLVDRAAIKKRLIDAVSLVKRRGERDNITVVLVKAYIKAG